MDLKTRLKNNCLIKDLNDIVWIVKNCDDLHNVQLESDSGGVWIDCFDPKCSDNVLNEIKLLKPWIKIN